MKKFFLSLFALATVAIGQAQSVDNYVDFLYRYMPVSDSIDHPREFWTANVESSLKARKEMPWGKKVPEREFRHFVLPVRVNNEDLDESRMAFYKELAPRIKGKKMADAVLEVNHWLHEKATYAPSDGRTSSPLATCKTTLGRCGEESTLGVAAFRSVGIPARQVYTPRWAHTDDNHAWIEVWVDGKWHFLGACEPEPVLDMAWFNAPAARGMLMGTNVFGPYDGPEQQLYQDNCYTRINVTSNYAPVRRAKVKVLNPDGTPASGADVSFRLYNYAEFYPLFSTKADANGEAELECGKGDLIVWASDSKGRWGFDKIAGDKDNVTVTLGKPADGVLFDGQLTPPVGNAQLPNPTAKQIAENDRRKVEEDNIRNARMATFFNAESAAKFVKKLGPVAQENSKRIVDLLVQTYGNGETWAKAFRRLPDKRIPEFLDWAATLSKKDLRDVSPEVIDDSFTANRVVSPRISNELLTPFNAQFDRIIPKSLAEQMKKNPMMIPAWLSKNVTLVDERNPNRYCISPAGALKARMADTHSCDILFCALCRWLGVPARIDAVTGKTQWKPNGGKEWKNIALGGSAKSGASRPNGTLKLTYDGSVPKHPQYYHHFAISKLVDGKPQLQEYEEEATVDNFVNGQPVEAGTYMLTSGRRLADGGVLARVVKFDVAAGKTTDVPLVITDDPQELSVVGNVNADPLLGVTGRGFFIYAIISPRQEPTSHLLNELKQNKQALEQWGKKIVLMFPDKDAANRWDKKMADGLPSNVVVITEPKPELLKEMAKEFEFEPNVTSLPAVLVGDSFNRVIFHNEGYRPGLGQRLVEMTSRLPE